MKKTFCIISVIILNTMGAYVIIKYANDFSLFEKAGLYFLVLPTLINSSFKLGYRMAFKEQEKYIVLFAPTTHTALCWTVYLGYITIHINYHFVFVLLFIANICTWLGLLVRSLIKNTTSSQLN